MNTEPLVHVLDRIALALESLNRRLVEATHPLFGVNFGGGPLDTDDPIQACGRCHCHMPKKNLDDGFCPWCYALGLIPAPGPIGQLLSPESLSELVTCKDCGVKIPKGFRPDRRCDWCLAKVYMQSDDVDEPMRKCMGCGWTGLESECKKNEQKTHACPRCVAITLKVKREDLRRGLT